MAVAFEIESETPAWLNKTNNNAPSRPLDSLSVIQQRKLCAWITSVIQGARKLRIDNSLKDDTEADYLEEVSPNDTPSDVFDPALDDVVNISEDNEEAMLIQLAMDDEYRESLSSAEGGSWDEEDIGMQTFGGKGKLILFTKTQGKATPFNGEKTPDATSLKELFSCEKGKPMEHPICPRSNRI